MTYFPPVVLNWKVVQRPDAMKYSIIAGDQFSSVSYGDAYKLLPGEIDSDSIKAVQAATVDLKPGEWLEVSHEATA